MAIEADQYSGVAHNNLGLLYFQRGELYQTAWEFDYAAKLMPNQPEPRNNLGMVLEAAGRVEEAIEQYGRSLSIDSDNAEVLGNLTRAHVRRGDKGEEVRELLSDLVLKDRRPEWLRWARRELAMRAGDR
jgi:Flp pilus assembly protein TadD